MIAKVLKFLGIYLVHVIPSVILVSVVLYYFLVLCFSLTCFFVDVLLSLEIDTLIIHL